MAEIDNWIKKQLKKGFKKEQIKDGLRKAGYPQDTIDSVDSIARKNKQIKQLVICLTVFLVVVIITLLIINNYADTNREVSKVQQLNPSFSYDHPVTLEEFNNFKDLCVGALDQGIIALESKELLEEQEVKEILCTLESREDCANCAGKYFRVFRILSMVPEFKSGQYISIAVSMNDLIKKLPDISEDDSFNFCSIAKPPLENNLPGERNLEQNPIFPEGEVFCSKTFKLNIPRIASLTGFVPKAELFNAEIYLVPQEVIPEILTKKSFSEAENIVKSYTLLWHLERPIVSQEQR